MCHRHTDRDRVWTGLEEEDDAEDDEGLPEFLNEEASEDTELLTDGGED